MPDDWITGEQIVQQGLLTTDELIDHCFHSRLVAYAPDKRTRYLEATTMAAYHLPEDSAIIGEALPFYFQPEDFARERLRQLNQGWESGHRPSLDYGQRMEFFESYRNGYLETYTALLAKMCFRKSELSGLLQMEVGDSENGGSELIAEPVIGPTVATESLTDPNEIITAIETRLPGIVLKPKERQYIKALIERLKGNIYKEAYCIAYPDTNCNDPNTLNRQGRDYCKKAITIVREKMGIVINPALIAGRT